MLACDRTITLVKYDGDSETYQLTPVSGVSWYDKTAIKQAGGGFAPSDSVMVRIPAAALPDTPIDPGDLIALGEVTEPIGRPADLASYRRVRVLTVGNNRRGSLPHLAVLCETWR